jgi:hypothetical protein
MALCLAILDERGARHPVEHCLARREHQLAGAGAVKGLSRLEQLRAGHHAGPASPGHRPTFSGRLFGALPESRMILSVMPQRSESDKPVLKTVLTMDHARAWAAAVKLARQASLERACHPDPSRAAATPRRPRGSPRAPGGGRGLRRRHPHRVQPRPAAVRPGRRRGRRGPRGHARVRQRARGNRQAAGRGGEHRRAREPGPPGHRGRPGPSQRG